MHKDSTALLVLHNINPINGGLTYSVMERAALLTEVYNQVVIFTFSHHFSFKKDVLYWKQKLNNSEKILFLNIFEDSDILGKDLDLIVEKKTDRKYRDKNKPNSYRVFSNGVYSRYEEYNKDGKIQFIDHFEAPWCRVAKSVFNEGGSKVAEHFMDKASNKIAFSAFFTVAGLPIYSCNYKNGKIVRYFNHKDCKEYESLENMLTAWLHTLISSYSNVTLFADKREYVKSFVKLPVTNLIFVLHSSHLSYPSDDLSKIDKSMVDVLELINEIDKMIVLNHSQKSELVNRFNIQEDKVIVIKHPQRALIDSERQHPDFHNLTVSSMARYHSAKNLSEAIIAFKQVVRIIPNAIYNIYGYGPEKAKLEALIKELKLEKNVFLKDFTTNTSKVYLESCLTVLSSRYEGQPLVVAESLAYGVPVISYDITYGPAEMIEDDVNGYLVEKYNKDQLASKIITLLLDKEKRKNMASQTHRIFELLSVDKSKNLWIDMARKLI
ncbi:glycosyltransferase [Psychrobacter celer]|uniref:glycosyltransferase n=1 Tax=Psychrobacter celer TaxID=306572 RepID=UPI003FD02EB9